MKKKEENKYGKGNGEEGENVVFDITIFMNYNTKRFISK